jgi:hypothetical protein
MMGCFFVPAFIQEGLVCLDGRVFHSGDVNAIVLIEETR